MSTTATDTILLRQGPDQSAGQHVYPWDGPWPPPRVLALVTEKATGRSKVCNPTEQPEGHMEWAQGSEEIDVEWYELHRHSAIERAALPEENWFRGAEYVRVVGA